MIIDQYRVCRLQRGLGQKHLRDVLQLRRFCKWARSQKLIKTDIAQELKAVRMVRSQRPIGLVEPEVHMLLRVAGQSRHGLAKRNYALVQLQKQRRLIVTQSDHHRAFIIPDKQH